MKKIKYFLLFLLFMPGIIKAKTNEGLLYEVLWQESGVNVFAEDKTYHSLDYDGWMVKSNNDNSVYYCIEPEYYMQLENDAVENSHYIYEHDNDITNNSNLTNETLEKVKLLSYYGYGYKSKTIDHTAKKWYGITQVMIWRIIRPEVNYVFRNTINGASNENLYIKEVEELQRLVSNHYKSPSFANTNVKLLPGEKITLIDENNCLDSYIINNDSTYSYEIINNKLIITAHEEANINVELKKEIINNNFALFKSLIVQNLILRGNINQSSSNFNLIIEGKEITIKKIDKDIGNFNENLVGTTFNIFDEKNNVITNIKIEEKEEKIVLPYGSYYLKEEGASALYKLNKKKYDFVVDDTTNNFEIIVENELLKGKLIINKTKGGSGEQFFFEENALFEIRKNNEIVNTIITDKKGKAEIELPYGIYEIKQINGDKNYIFIEPFIVEINEEKIYEYNLVNLKKSKLEILKVDYSSNKPIAKTKIALYKDNNALVMERETDENGKISIENLDIGKYYLKEITPAKYYRLSNEKIKFEVVNNGQLIKLNISNEKKEGNLLFEKVDSISNEPLEGAKIEIYYYDTDELVFSGFTDEYGKISLNDLQAGQYYLIEKEEPYGYIRSKNKLNFEIVDDQEIVRIVMTNEKIVIPNTSSINYNNLVLGIINIGLIIILKRKNVNFIK